MSLQPNRDTGSLSNGGGSRCSGWATSIITSGAFRRRILHDVIVGGSEEGAREIYERLVRRARNYSRGNGIMAFALHLQGEHSHVHTVHDCAWTSTQCKDAFLQGILQGISTVAAESDKDLLLELRVYPALSYQNCPQDEISDRWKTATVRGKFLVRRDNEDLRQALEKFVLEMRTAAQVEKYRAYRFHE